MVSPRGFWHGRGAGAESRRQQNAGLETGRFSGGCSCRRQLGSRFALATRAGPRFCWPRPRSLRSASKRSPHRPRPPGPALPACSAGADRRRRGQSQTPSSARPGIVNGGFTPQHWASLFQGQRTARRWSRLASDSTRPAARATRSRCPMGCSRSGSPTTGQGPVRDPLDGREERNATQRVRLDDESLATHGIVPRSPAAISWTTEGFAARAAS
jgi:hypothetical protein